LQYLYHSDASSSRLELVGDEHRYIFRVRRHRVGESIYLRNLTDNHLYHYTITSLDKRQAILSLVGYKESVVIPDRELHIGWCMIDPKSIEKMLSTLNEIGVSKITFIYCSRSQKQFKLDFERLNKIILNSSQQSGRSEMMKLEVATTLKDFLLANPKSYLLNFSDNHISSDMSISSIVIGCEGGLTEDEIILFDDSHVVGLDTPLILKSESAIATVAAKLII